MIVKLIISEGNKNIAYKINYLFSHQSVHSILSYL